MPSEIGKQRLFDFIEELDKELTEKIRITAVGGTAMTLLDLKNSTRDVDFESSSKNEKALLKAKETLNPGFEIDLFWNGLIFAQQLPDDYNEKAIPIKEFEHIELFALSPLDIVVSKIARFNERDEQDIKACIQKASITKEQLKERASQLGLTAITAEDFRYHLTLVLEQMF